ncbi:Lsr2 family protein [Amycolatopsis sp. NPDC059021]|uniref:histone-like nucleoid-structuring protein Lsr2 n=1 Tax=Amycolatopsis sp. NPDC059021 TaxID=3346704 RepID=UPI003671C824
MAQKVFVQLTDDIDGSEAAQTVPFALDGVSYEIDLSDANADDLRDTLAQYVSAARRVGGRKVRLAAGQSAASDGSAATPVDRERSRAIRAWAVENGYAVSDRGRIPTEVVEAFEAASAEAEKAAPRGRRSRKKTAA